MKFLFTTSFYPPFHVGGACTHVKYLAESLAAKGHEVHVLYSIDAYNFKRKEKRKPEPEGRVILHELRSPLGKLEPVLNFALGSMNHTYRAFSDLVDRENFDVVHHHNISLLGYDLLKKRGSYKNIYTAHDFWLICHKYNYTVDGEVCDGERNCFICATCHRFPYQFFRKSRDFQSALKDIDLIITPSRFMAGILENTLKHKIITIPNLVPSFGIRPKKKEREYFLYVGQLERHKGILQLMEIFKGSNERLLIVGAGELEDRIRAECRENIRLLGWKGRKELAELYAGAKALIVPSLWAENFPTVAIEAMQFGTPTITTDIGGTREIVSLVDSSLVFPSDDFGRLKEIIKSFDTAKYKPKKLRNIYDANFSPDKYIERYLEALI